MACAVARKAWEVGGGALSAAAATRRYYSRPAPPRARRPLATGCIGPRIRAEPGPCGMPPTHPRAGAVPRRRRQARLRSLAVRTASGSARGGSAGVTRRDPT